MRSIILFAFLSILAFTCQAQTQPQTTPTANLDAKLLNDLSRTDYLDVAKEWSKLYDRLDRKFRTTVHTRNGTYEMDYGDLYGLNKGFYWGLCGNHADSRLGDTIVEEFGATGGRSKAIEVEGYRAGIVYFYVKYSLLKCE